MMIKTSQLFFAADLSSKQSGSVFYAAHCYISCDLSPLFLLKTCIPPSDHLRSHLIVSVFRCIRHRRGWTMECILNTIHSYCVQNTISSMLNYNIFLTVQKSTLFIKNRLRTYELHFKRKLHV